MKLDVNPYIRLMRLYQPTGIWLLLWPCLWSVTLASHGRPSFLLMVLFAVGAIAMRGAGCIVNDLADQKIDAQVERTRLRPLASGELSEKNALLFLGVLLFIALIVVLYMPRPVFKLAVFSLVLAALYPFMKRITWWPQAFLGITFNWGALMGWDAVMHQLGWPALFLYVAGFFWTLGYDTIYAHQDKEDDVRIGVKSSALYLGDKTKPAIAGFYGLAVIFWLVAGWLAECQNHYYVCIAAVALHCAWQVKNLDINNPANCLERFRANAWLGVLIFLGALIY